MSNHEITRMGRGELVQRVESLESDNARWTDRIKLLEARAALAARVMRGDFDRYLRETESCGRCGFLRDAEDPACICFEIQMGDPLG